MFRRTLFGDLPLNGVVCNQCREKLHVWLIESVAVFLRLR